ncbi:MAG TPA: hypothetical protein DHW07_07365 [Gammaproteobacteria bacterium]|nr:hypothetical protein [Gammaproteobacteria bacterium]
MMPHFIRIADRKRSLAKNGFVRGFWLKFCQYSGLVFSALCLATLLEADDTLVADLESILEGQPVPEYRVLPVTKLNPSIHETPLTLPPLVLSPGVLTPFLDDAMLMDEMDAETLGRVITGPEGNVLLGQFSRFLAQNLPPSGSGLYTVFRRGDVLVHPVSGEHLATTAHVVGVAQLDAPGEVATLTMVSSTEEAIPGDYLVSHKTRLRTSYLYPAPARVSLDAYVVSTFGSTSGAGGYSLVAISVGSDDGIRPGNLLTTRYPEQTILLTKKTVSPAHAGDNCRVTDVREAVHVRMLRCDERVPSRHELAGKETELVRLPEGHSGELLVIRVFDRVSYALVRSAERTVHIGDRVVSPGV